MKGYQRAKTLAKVLAGLLLLCFAVAGCMRYSMVKSDQSVRVGSTFTVETPINWSKSKQGVVETWTVDGPNLQRLIFFTGIAEDQPLFPAAWGSKKQDLPTYKSIMNSLEIEEFIETSLARNGAYQITTRDLRPAMLDNLKGFRFEFSYLVESGLKYDGFVVGAKQEDKLLAIMYVGTALHHYGKHLNDAEKIIASAVVK